MTPAIRDESARLVTPQGRRILAPREIRQIRRLAARANPGPYSLVTDTCECGGDWPCNHGEFPFEMRSRGIQTPGFDGRMESATLYNFDGAAASVEDGRFWESLDPETVIALCDLAESAYSEIQSAAFRDSWGRTFGLAVELESFPTHELLNEIMRRTDWK